MSSSQQSAASRKARRFAYCLAQGYGAQEAASAAFPQHQPDPSQLTDLREAAEKAEVVRYSIDPAAFEPGELRDLREELHHVPYQDVEARLRTQSGGTLRSLWVFNSGLAHKPYEPRIVRFAANAAWRVRELLHGATDSGVVAVAFGGTIGAVVRAVLHESWRVPIQLATGKRPVIIPTACDPLGDLLKQQSHSSTALAALLRQAFAGAKESPSLESVDPVLPGSIPDDVVTSIKDRYLRQHTGYAAVFGSDASEADALIARTDVILTSAGSFHSPFWKYFGNERMKPEACGPSDEIAELADGDVAGLLLQKPGLSKAKVDRYNFWVLRWTGIAKRHLSALVEKGASAPPLGPSGCVLCALGENKASITKRLICEDRLVNHLVCDRSLFDALVRLV